MNSTSSKQWQNVQPIRYQNNLLELLDQRLLPHEEKYLSYNDPIAVANAITDMVVRGAPAIGITAAYGIVLAAKLQLEQNATSLNLSTAFDVLAQSRPTAVNLFWALKQMQSVFEDNSHLTVKEQFTMLEATANRILKQDILANQTMGEFGASLIDSNSQVYTHCNAGALATGGYGTALGVIRSAFASNKISQVFAGETRPWLQGSRLTAWELLQDNIPVKISTEGSAGQLFRKGDIKWVIVGADRIAANGDVANKIGTYNLAILAKHHNVKFMVVAPTTTFDLTIKQGSEIPIEERAADEVTQVQNKNIAPKNCLAINPSFDMTPNDLIDVIICEKGILTAPFEKNIAELIKVSQ